jgi:hypothetical protein
MLSNTGNANFTVENCIFNSTGVAATTALLQVFQTTGTKVINCKFINAGSTNGVGINLYRAGLEISRSEFTNVPAGSAIFASQAKNVSVRSTSFDTVENGLDMQQGSNASMDDSFCTNVTNNAGTFGGQGNCMVCYKTQGCKFTNNKVVVAALSGLRCNWCTNLTVTGNNIDRSGDNAIYFEQPDGNGSYSTTAASIAGNTITRSREGIYAANGNDNGLWGATISGNYVAHCLGWGMDTTGGITPYVYGIGVSKNVKVVGNTVDGCPYGLITEQGSQADANEGITSDSNSYIDKRYVSIDTTGANITGVAAGHILVVPSSATYETATKRCWVKSVPTAAHLVVQCTKGFLAAADTLQDLNNTNTGTIASGGVFGPTLQRLVLTGTGTGFKFGDRVGNNATIASSTATGIIAYVNATDIYVYDTQLQDFWLEDALDFSGAPLWIGPFVNSATMYDYDAGTNVALAASGNPATVPNGVSPYCAATSNCQQQMEVGVMFSSSTPATHPVQTSTNDIFGSYSVQPYGGHTSLNGTTNVVPSSAAIVRSVNRDVGALTSFGTSPTYTGTDLSGTITVGTGGSTAGVFTFATPYTTVAPDCPVGGPVLIVPAVTTTTITFNAVLTSGQKISFVCSGGR